MKQILKEENADKFCEILKSQYKRILPVIHLIFLLDSSGSMTENNKWFNGLSI